jgi:hypothetical protein
VSEAKTWPAVKILDGAYVSGEVVDSSDGMDFDSILSGNGMKTQMRSRSRSKPRACSRSRSRIRVRRNWGGRIDGYFEDTSLDPMMTCAQSETSSVKAFHTLSFRGKNLTSASVYSGDHSIISSDTHESWDFERVTGMPNDTLGVLEHYRLWSFRNKATLGRMPGYSAF